MLLSLSKKAISCYQVLKLFSCSQLKPTDHGTVAALAGNRKRSKYSSLGSTLYMFMPIAIETLGALGSKSLIFIKELEKMNHITL